jgi:glyoxylase-like metal-dependent hydrolase (beta-lactamase superfamily II)
MSTAGNVTIVNAGYRSTNYWVVSAGSSRVLVDLGWPGTIGTMTAMLQRINVPIAELRYGIATHYHIDHAGAAEDLKLLGVPLLMLESQVSAIPLMKRHTKPQDHYTEITSRGNVVISFTESRGLLARLGIAGEIVPTPGHSDDSVSLLLDSGAGFVGDLTPLSIADGEQAGIIATSWQKLRDLGVTTIYPGHGRPRPMTLP